MATGFKGFALDLETFASRLASAASDAEGLVRGQLQVIATRAARRARRLTPRSKGGRARGAKGRFAKGGGAGHIGDGWQATAHGAFSYDVENTDPRATEPIALLGGGETTLLEILEFGSRPHEIVPRKPGGLLRFVDAGTGEVIYTNHVSHPGTRPYSMVGIAANEAAIQMKQLADAVRALVRNATRR